MPYLRFYRRIPIIPGLLYLNLSKGGVSISIGKRGWTVTFGKHGVRFTAGLPGTDLFVTEHVNYEKINVKEREKEAPSIEQFIGERDGTKEER